MYHFIINPASRSGKGGKVWREVLKPILDERDVHYFVYYSEKPGDVSRLAKYITEKVPGTKEDLLRLIVVGGDGTVNEALQGISDYQNMVLGYIPIGSGGDLARDLGLSKSPEKILLSLLEAEKDASRIHFMDKGEIDVGGKKTAFGISMGLGFDAAVCEALSRSRLKSWFNTVKLGKLSYLFVALKQIFAAKRVDCDLYIDDNPTPVHIKKFFFAAAMNHRYEGGGFKFCPKAKDSDGYLNLCVVSRLPKMLILLLLPTAFFGFHFIFPGVDHYRARKIVLQAEIPLSLHTDGEVHAKAKNVAVSCIPKQIPFLL